MEPKYVYDSQTATVKASILVKADYHNNGAIDIYILRSTFIYHHTTFCTKLL